MKSEELLRKLKTLGVEDPKIEIMPWGTYWYSIENEFKEGHEVKGIISIWPYTPANKPIEKHKVFE